MTPDQYREEAKHFCLMNLHELCREVVDWHDSGTLGHAPYFYSLTEQCKLYAGVEYGRRVAESLVRTQAMRECAAES